MSFFTPFIFLPAFAALCGLAVMDRLQGDGYVWRAVWIGMIAGLLAAVAYDVFRLPFVFAKEWGDVNGRGDAPGRPLQSKSLGQREYARLIKAAKVRPIKFHGLRHTCATLLLQAGQPIHVVSERLGHAKVSMTMDVYAHVLPDMQQDAAATLGMILHG